MDSIHSTTDDASSIQHLWSREQISQLVLQIRLEQNLFGSNKPWLLDIKAGE